MTVFVQEGRWMVNAARKYNRIVQVGMRQRSGPSYQKARELLRGGHIGQIMSARMGAYRNIMPGFGSPPDATAPHEIDYEMWLGPAPLHAYNAHRARDHFRGFWGYSGGQQTNLRAHGIGLVHGVTGS